MSDVKHLYSLYSLMLSRTGEIIEIYSDSNLWVTDFIKPGKHLPFTSNGTDSWVSERGNGKHFSYSLGAWSKTHWRNFGRTSISSDNTSYNPRRFTFSWLCHVGGCKYTEKLRLNYISWEIRERNEKQRWLQLVVSVHNRTHLCHRESMH